MERRQRKFRRTHCKDEGFSPMPSKGCMASFWRFSLPCGTSREEKRRERAGKVRLALIEIYLDVRGVSAIVCRCKVISEDDLLKRRNLRLGTDHIRR